MSSPLLSLNDLAIVFRHGPRHNYAVQHLSYDLYPGEVMGIVGESGSGKSVHALAIMGLLPPSARITKGAIFFQGQNMTQMPPKTHRMVCAHAMGIIFQNPSSSLNPYLTIGTQLTEAVRLHKKFSKRKAMEQAERLLERLHINEARKRLTQYPHELSGGMCQRVMIAMALMMQPSLLIADEPTTALDVTIQAQILGLLSEIMKEKGSHMSMILISHDMGVVAHMADRILVMYAGSPMEMGDTSAVLTHPVHPYTQALLTSTPDLTTPPGPLPFIPGQSPLNSPSHTQCPFHLRCRYVKARCKNTFPSWETQLNQSHRCLYPLHQKTRL